MVQTGRGFVPDQNAVNPQIVLVGEAPGGHEIEEGKPFVGKAGFVLKQWLLRAVAPLQVALERNQVTIANTLRCLPPEIQNRAYPRGQEKLDAERCCNQYNSWEQSAAHTVVLFGESAQRRWFAAELEAEDFTDRKLGREVKGVMGRIGRVIERDGRRWVFCIHPAAVLRQPSLVSHAQQALQIAVQTEREVKVAYEPNWESSIETLSKM